MENTNPTPIGKEDLFDQFVIRKWEEPESRKLMKGAHSKLSEVLQQVKTAQASLLMRCDPVYRERLAEVFVSQLGALECTLVMLKIAANGVLMVPKGWVPPHESEQGK